jgi:FixJ family two-component response regulator
VVARDAETTEVYIVDDDDSVRTSFVRLMRSAGLNPHAYASAELFLEEVRDLPHACILLDITMPRISGLEVQARLNARHIQLPVITITARDDDETRSWARSLGACMFLRKPVDDQALLDAISWATGGNRER